MTTEPLGRMPYWPRRMAAPVAAAYLGIGETKFLADVGAGKYPQPIRDGARVLWDRSALDETVDSQFRLPQTANPILRKLRESRHARSQ